MRTNYNRFEFILKISSLYSIPTEMVEECLLKFGLKKNSQEEKVAIIDFIRRYSFRTLPTDIVNEIPDSVKELTFGHYFNQTVTGGIPKSVTHLTFGACFDKSIKGCIPSKV